MSWPDTIDQAAGRILERIERGAGMLGVEPDHYTENEEQTAFRLAAYAGAHAYAEYLRQAIDDASVTDALLDQAELVATAAEFAGWIGASGAVVGREKEMQLLVAGGYFAFHPLRPGEYVACYRLVAP